MKPEKGDPLTDPVAQSIRNQQMQDAAPSPAEREELARESNTCDRCDTHDPERVKMRDEHYKPACSAVQQPPTEPIHLCNECYDPTTQDDMIAKTLERYEYVALYACGVVRGFDQTHGRDTNTPHSRTIPRVEVECRCGATLKNVYEAGDDDA